MASTDPADAADLAAEPADSGFVSLYRRYRPGRFEELRGQPHVVKALRSAVSGGSVAHAYLFSGPRGTGKTSAARILARALDCANPEDGEPCGHCTSCREIARGQSLDVHELDAASNNGVDAMRDLVAHAALGTPGRWKVYIVDEVHMLSNAAANALLKTLEEPPSHVVFVLATTDPQKVPPTIRSRTQHFEFRLLGPAELEALVRDVREDAGLELDDASLAAAVRRGRGSARDTLSALDQMVAIGGADDSRPGAAVVTGALEDDPSAVLVALSELIASGWAPQQIATEVVDELRQAFLLNLSPSTAEVTGTDRDRLVAAGQDLGLAKVVRGIELLGQAIVDMREAPDTRVVLEVALVRVALPELDPGAEGLVERVARLERLVESSGVSTSGPSETSRPSRSPRLSDSLAEAAAAPPARDGVPPRPSAPAPAPGAPTPGAPAPGAPAPGAPAPGAPAPGAPASASGSVGGPVSLPDRDTLVEAWGDHILKALPARAKAFCSAGRFVGVAEGAALFALPNAAHRDRCEDVRGMLEAALRDFFGTPVPIRLVVEGEQAGAPRAPDRRPPGAAPSRRSTAAGGADRHPGGGAPRSAASSPEEQDDDFDPTEFDTAEPVEGGVESIAEAKLLDAFPGAQEVSE